MKRYIEMNHFLQHIKSLAVLLAVSLSLAACHDDFRSDSIPDQTREASPAIEEDVEVDAVISLNIPRMHGVQTRALTAEQEKQADDIHILAFEAKEGETDESKEILSYEVRQVSKPTHDASTGKYTVKVRLKTKKNRQRLVILANYPGEIGTHDAGTEKETLYKRMQTDFTKWKVNGEKSGAVRGTDYDLIPMWGESDLQLVSDKSLALTFNDWQSDMPIKNTIYLYRSLARVDVGIDFKESMTEDNTSGETPNPDGDKVKDFKLTKVYVYRYNTKYQIPGSQSTFAEENGASPKMISSPIIPTGSALANVNDPLVYEVKDNDGKVVRSIYIPESRKPSDGNASELRDKATCLVIGGIYTGKVGNIVKTDNTKESYYRVDFLEGGQSLESKEELKYMDILRNHRYRINITKVGGPGYDTPQEALKHNDYSIFYTVSVWNNADLSRVLTDGQYMLGIDKDRFVFGRRGGVDIPNAITDWPEGWTATILPDDNGNIPDWIRLGDPEGTTTECDTRDPSTNDFYGPLQITTKRFSDEEIKKVQGNADKPISRYAKIRLKAGRMEWDINVEQMPREKPLLRLLAAESVKDTKEYRSAYSANEYWNNWTIPTRETSASVIRDFELFSLADASDVPVETPRYGVHATIEFNGNTPYDQPMYYDRRLVVLQWGPEDAEATRGSVYNQNDDESSSVSGTPKPMLYVNSLTSIDFDIKAFSADTDIKIKGATVQPLTDLINEPSHFRYYDATSYVTEIAKWADAPNTIVLLITAPGLEGNDDPFESRYNELEFILDAYGTGIGRSDTGGEETFDNASVLKCNLSLSQQESSAIPYFDKECINELIKWVGPETGDKLEKGNNISRYVDAGEGLYLMNGVEKAFYVRANSPYRIELVKQELKIVDGASLGQIPKDGTVGPKNEGYPGLFISDFYGKPATSNTPPEYGQFRSSGVVLGEPVNFTSVDDTHRNIRKSGTATFRLVSNHPIRKQFRDRVFTIRFVSAVTQPEANSYMMLRGGQGILIPVSRINTAKRFYNEVILERPDTDTKGRAKGSDPSRSASSDFLARTQFLGLGDEEEWTVEVEWADNLTNYEKPVDPDGSALIRELRPTGVGSASYIYVEPGNDHVGNAMIVVKNMRGAILWSWHLWIMDEYPSIITVPVDKTNIDQSTNAIQQYWMDRNLGATERLNPSNRRTLKTRTNTYGFLYQHGRKDPFPTVTVEETHYFSDADGSRYLFASRGSEHSLLGTTFSQMNVIASIPETIQQPSSPIYNPKDWMYERVIARSIYSKAGRTRPAGSRANYFLWGGRLQEAQAQWTPYYVPSGRRMYRNWVTYKTPFDPCPYGWKVPAMGQECRWGTFLTGDVGDMDDPKYFTAFYRASPNPQGAPGEKTIYTVERTTAEAGQTFPIPGVIYDGGYDASGVNSIVYFASVLQRYRSEEWAKTTRTQSDAYDRFRDNTDIRTGNGGNIRAHYHSSCASNNLAINDGSGMYIRISLMNKDGYYGEELRHTSATFQYGCAVPIRAVANRITKEGGEEKDVSFWLPVHNAPYDKLSDERITNWTFKDESDWTKYLPKK